MALWLEGWIEVARLPETAEEHAWFGVVNLGSLLDAADRDTERLFGISKACVSGEKAVDAIAARRGLPPNPSEQVHRALQVIAAHKAKFGAGEFGGYTHATWAEIRDYELVEAPAHSEWRVPFELARVLEGRFGADRVRIIVWFNW